VTIRSRSVRAILGASSAGLLLHGAATNARAGEPEGTRFHLAYEAPASCPDRAAFIGAIRLRTRRPQLAAEGEAATAFSVTVEPSRERMLGRLEVHEPEAGLGAPAPTETRTVSSGTCAEVTKALALVVALILDPDAETGVEPQGGPPAEDERDALEDPAIPAAPLEDPAIPAAPLPPPPRPAAREQRPPRPAVGRPVELSAGAELAVTGAVGPGITPKGDAFIDITFTSRAGGRGLVFAPSVRLGGGFAATASDLVVGSHRYWWAGGTARFCPMRLVLPSGLRLLPCGAMQVGAHHGSTQGVPNGTTSTDLWLAPGGVASLEWAFGSSLAVELQGGAIVPLLRTRFFLAPDTTIFSVPAIAATGGIAARLRFW